MMEIIQNGTTLQNLYARVAFNRASSGDYNKEELLKNVRILLADLQITGEQYAFIKDMVQPPVIQKEVEDTNPPQINTTLDNSVQNNVTQTTI